MRNSPPHPAHCSLVCGEQEWDGQVAQLVEHRTENPGVAGSIPALATSPKTPNGCRKASLPAFFRIWISLGRSLDDASGNGSQVHDRSAIAGVSDQFADQFDGFEFGVHHV